MQSPSFLRYPTALLAVTILSGCSGEPTPEYYGVFAVQAGKLVELSKDKGKIEIELDPSTKFVVYDKSVADLINSVKLVPHLYLRKQIIQPRTGLIQTGKGQLVDASTWIVDSKDGPELRAQPAKKNPEIVYFGSS